MEHHGDLSGTYHLPEPNPQNTLEAMQVFHHKADEYLTALDQRLNTALGCRVSLWHEQLQAARHTQSGKEHTIGIIGATGAGKSTLANALLDEESLVPTSCMQACTATAIEIAYNTSSSHSYRAVVHFVSRESWQKEVVTLLGHLTSGADDDFQDSTSAAAIALAKLSAVYPDLDREKLSKLTVQALFVRPGLGVLGTRLKINASNGCELNKKLQKYVESNEKAQSSSGAPQALEYWPLTLKVRIFTKAAVLRTGCILVDLPGMADINAARASVAKEYLVNCTSLWIVVPITRAINDKLFRDILGDTFTQQLRRDGSLNNITIICTKADQCSAHELRKAFKPDSSSREKMDKIKSSHKRAVKESNRITKNLEKKKKICEDTTDRIMSLESDYDAYTRLLERARAGNTVHPPILSKKKRGTLVNDQLSRKSLKLHPSLLPVTRPLRISDTQDGPVSLDSEYVSRQQSSRSRNVEQDVTQPAMTLENIRTRMKAVRESEDKIREDQIRYRTDLTTEEEKLQDSLGLIASLANQEWDLLYEARNNHVSKCLYSEFEYGIQRLKQVEREKDDDFDPDVKVEEDVKQQDVQIFCTASQAFQKFRGRFAEETVSYSLTGIVQTGIPELMQHCIAIGEKTILWLFSSDSGDAVSPAVGFETVQNITEELRQSITGSSRKTLDKCHAEVRYIEGLVSVAAEVAENQSMDIVRAWAGYPNAHRTALPWQTFRAVVKYGGEFANERYGEINWTAELLDPMKQRIDGSWNHTFNEVIPAALTGTRKDCSCFVDSYLVRLEKKAEYLNLSEEVREIFKSQFGRLDTTLGSALRGAHSAISLSQRQANRASDEVVRSELRSLSAELASDSGAGVIKRNKQRLGERIDIIKCQMFTDAANKVKHELVDPINEALQSLSQYMHQSLNTLLQDCERVFPDETYVKPTMTSKDEASIKDIIRNFEIHLKSEITVSKGQSHSPPVTKHELRPDAKKGIHKKRPSEQGEDSSTTGLCPYSSSESSESGDEDESD